MPWQQNIMLTLCSHSMVTIYAKIPYQPVYRLFMRGTAIKHRARRSVRQACKQTTGNRATAWKGDRRCNAIDTNNPPTNEPTNYGAAKGIHRSSN